MTISYQFVPYGASAPDKLPENQFWLDVGNRADQHVFDHHGGDTDVKSAFALILKRFKEHTIPRPESGGQVCLVLHVSPDLDAVSSAWLMKKILTQPGFKFSSALHQIEKAVNDNDQGLVRADSPMTCWPIVMRTILGRQMKGRGDQERLAEGLALLEKTYEILEKELSLDQAAASLVSPFVQKELDAAVDLYTSDVSSAEIFQVSLPRSTKDGVGALKTKADTIILDNPKSVLFKELARADRKNSPQKQGFDLLIVVRKEAKITDRNARRYIISTDPLSGFHLKGLGACLEKMEQEREDAMGLPLLGGRARVGNGHGRHGYNVASPWYDGRGHGFTIVDSPSLSINGETCCASVLTIDDVKRTVVSFWTKS